MTKIIYLTIDDAPSVDFMPKLDFLDAHQSKAVWFCQGNYLEQRPEYALEALRRGHLLGNHTYTHPHCSDLALDQVYAEIRATDAVLRELYHHAGVVWEQRFFRFPYGDKGAGRQENGLSAAERQERHAAIQRYLQSLHYTLPTFADITYDYFAAWQHEMDWLWTFDTHDWALNYPDAPHGINTLDKMIARMDEDVPAEGRGLNRTDSADIVLIHDHTHTTAIFPKLIEHLLTKGVRFALPQSAT